MLEPLNFMLIAQQTLFWSKFGVLLLAAIVIVVILSLVTVKTSRKFTVGLLAAILGMFVVVVFLLMPFKRDIHVLPVEAAVTQEIRMPHSQSQPRAYEQQFDSLYWPKNDEASSEELFHASPFKFRGSAVRGLARQCGTHLLELNLKNITTIRIGSIAVPSHEIDGNEENQLLSDRIEFINELSKQLPPSVEISERNQQELNDHEISILLDFSKSANQRDYADFPTTAPLYREGIFTAEIMTRSATSERFRTQFQQLEWVTNFSNFNQNCNNVFVHVSAEWEPKESEARSSAIRNAVDELAPMLKEEVDAMLIANRWGERAISRSDVEQHLNDYIRRNINASEYHGIVDRFSQTLTLENGVKSYREELLLHKHGFEPVVSRLVSLNQHQRQSFQLRCFSLFGLVGVVLITYFSANAATRGYAVVSVGALCIGLFVGGLVLITFISV